MRVIILQHRRQVIAFEEFIYKNKRHYKGLTLASIRSALQKLGNKVSTVDAADEDFITKLRQIKPQLVFNFLLNSIDNSFATYTVASLELLGIPHTASNFSTHFIANDIMLLSKILSSAGISTLPFQYINRLEDISSSFDLPVILKPTGNNLIHAQQTEFLIESRRHLRLAAQDLLRRYASPILIYPKVDGRELVIGLLSNEQPFLLPILECADAAEHGASYTRLSFWRTSIRRAKLTQQEYSAVKSVALRSYLALNCYDYVTMGIKLCTSGEILVEWVNTLPDIFLNHSALHRMAEEAGIGFQGLIQRIVSYAQERYML